jgi:hypothetical protein
MSFRKMQNHLPAMPCLAFPKSGHLLLVKPTIRLVGSYKVTEPYLGDVTVVLAIECYIATSLTQTLQNS